MVLHVVWSRILVPTAKCSAHDFQVVSRATVSPGMWAVTFCRRQPDMVESRHLPMLGGLGRG